MEENKKVIEENITDQEALKKYQKEIESGKYQLDFVENGANGDATYDDGSVTLVNVIEIEREELSPEARKRVEELIKNIEEWQKELDTIWKDRNTDAAEMERRNLRQLIDNAKREIKSIKGIVEEKEPLPDPKEYLENLKEIEKKKEETIKNIKEQGKEIDIQINRIGLQIEKLKEEKEMYGSQKNTSYVSISEEYDKKIENLEEEKKKLEEEKAKVQKKLKEVEEQKIEEDKIKAYQTLKKGIKDVEAEIDIIKEQIHNKYKEINKAIEEGQKTPNGIPMVLELYKDLDKLREELENKESEKRELQEWLEKIDGKENVEKLNLNKEQQSEMMRFFHGQGDIVENVQRDENGNVIGNTNRDDRRGNDEYFGFEKIEGNRKDKDGRGNNDDSDEKDNGGKDNGGKDNGGKDNGGKDNGEKDSGGKDNGEKDNGEKDNGGKDNGEKDNGGKDNGEKDNGEKDNGEKDNGGKGTGKKLPIRSFWEIYNDTNTEHASNLAIKLHGLAHMKILPSKEEDLATKVLSAPLIPIKAATKLLSFIPNKLMGTDKKMKRLQENISTLSPQEFEVLVSTPEQIGDESVKASYDRYRLDPQFMKQYKSNELYLQVVSGRLTADRTEQVMQCNAQIEQIDSILDSLDQKRANEGLSPTEQQNYINLQLSREHYVELGKESIAEIDRFNEGIKKKSSGYKNIQGWFLAKFNPDNRKQNAQMAEMSKDRREAAELGDYDSVFTYSTKMREFAKLQTKIGKGVDGGAYSIEGALEQLNRGEDNRGRMLLSDGATFWAIGNLWRQVALMNRNQVAIDAHNQQVLNANKANSNIQVSGQTSISNAPGIDTAKVDLAHLAKQGDFNLSERGALDASGWNTASQGYTTLDQFNHAQSEALRNTIEQNLRTGNYDGALDAAVQQYCATAGKVMPTIQDWAKLHPEILHGGMDYASAVHMKYLQDFFTTANIPYNTQVAGTMINTMQGIENGLNLLPAVFAATQAVQQATKQGVRDGFKSSIKQDIRAGGNLNNNGTANRTQNNDGAR